MYKNILIIYTWMILLGTLGAQQTILAVIDFEGKGVSEIEASALTDRLRTEIVKISLHTVVERGAMEEVLKEQGFQQSGCVSSECIVEAGKLLGANQIIGGSIAKVGNTFTISARVIDIETGRIANSVNYDYTGVIDEILINGMRNVSRLLLVPDGTDEVEFIKDFEYYANGNIKGEGKTINGIKNGRWLFYFSDGSMEYIGNYKNGNKHGEWIHYYNDGNIKSQGTYINGKKHGEWVQNYSNGNIESQGNYIAGKKHGVWISNYLDGMVKSHGKYVEDAKQDEWKHYYTDARLASIEKYKNDNPTETWIYYDTSGSKIGEILYRNGKKHGEFVKWNPNGDITSNERWRNGILIYQINYNNGKPTHSFEYKYLFGLMRIRLVSKIFYSNGTTRVNEKTSFFNIYKSRTLYDSTGTLVKKNRFIFGRGVYVDIYNDGRIKETGLAQIHRDGTFVRDGEWYFYNESGDSIRVITYDFGIQVRERVEKK